MPHFRILRIQPCIEWTPTIMHDMREYMAAWKQHLSTCSQLPATVLAFVPITALRFNKDFGFIDRSMRRNLTSVRSLAPTLCWKRVHLDSAVYLRLVSKEPLQPWLDNQNLGPASYLQRQMVFAFPVRVLIFSISYLLFADFLLQNDLFIWLIVSVCVI